MSDMAPPEEADTFRTPDENMTHARMVNASSGGLPEPNRRQGRIRGGAHPMLRRLQGQSSVRELPRRRPDDKATVLRATGPANTAEIIMAVRELQEQEAARRARANPRGLEAIRELPEDDIPRNKIGYVDKERWVPPRHPHYVAPETLARMPYGRVTDVAVNAVQRWHTRGIVDTSGTRDSIDNPWHAPTSMPQQHHADHGQSTRRVSRRDGNEHRGSAASLAGRQARLPGSAPGGAAGSSQVPSFGVARVPDAAPLAPAANPHTQYDARWGYMPAAQLGQHGGMVVHAPTAATGHVESVRYGAAAWAGGGIATAAYTATGPGSHMEAAVAGANALPAYADPRATVYRAAPTDGTMVGADARAPMPGAHQTGAVYRAAAHDQVNEHRAAPDFSGVRAVHGPSFQADARRDRVLDHRSAADVTGARASVGMFQGGAHRGRVRDDRGAVSIAHGAAHVGAVPATAMTGVAVDRTGAAAVQTVGGPSPVGVRNAHADRANEVRAAADQVAGAHGMYVPAMAPTWRDGQVYAGWGEAAMPAAAGSWQVAYRGSRSNSAIGYVPTGDWGVYAPEIVAPGDRSSAGLARVSMAPRMGVAMASQYYQW